MEMNEIGNLNLHIMRRITWQLKNQKPFEPYTQKAFFLLKNGNIASKGISHYYATLALLKLMEIIVPLLIS
jgi:hypothetical protein